MTVTVIGMIYKSLSYLRFMQQAMALRCQGAELLIVANDATPQVLDALPETGIPFVDYRDPKPDDYYLNRVYRAWNYGAKCATTDVIVYINSDMWMAPDWLPNILRHLASDTIPCSRLVESGKMPSGKHGVSKNFGRNPSEFHCEEFERYASELSEPKLLDGGLYMPCAFDRREFLAAGGYPEGNICEGGIGAHGTRFIRSGDDHFFHHTLSHKRHVTVADSLVYHIIEGERDT